MATVITLPDGTAYHEGVEFARLEILKRALASANGNRTQAAIALGLNRTYLQRLLRERVMIAMVTT